MSNLPKSSKQVALSNEREWSDLIEQLVEIRVNKGLSQQDVADLLGVTQPAIAQLEYVTSNPTINRIKLYALALGVELQLGVKK
jgi:transcriptional regulator with XRE-family HTH domain